MSDLGTAAEILAWPLTYLSPFDPCSERWRQLVRDGRIESLSFLHGAEIRYGLRLEGTDITEFAEWTGEGGGQQLEAQTLEKQEGPFAVKLVSNRRLRPSPAFGGKGGTRNLAPHVEEDCSLCSGALRLELREKAAQIRAGSGRLWDLHFNIAPIEKVRACRLVQPGSRARRHFLSCRSSDEHDCQAASTPHACACRRVERWRP